MWELGARTVMSKTSCPNSLTPEKGSHTLKVSPVFLNCGQLSEEGGCDPGG